MLISPSDGDCPVAAIKAYHTPAGANSSKIKQALRRNRSRQKFSTIPARNKFLQEGEPCMRLANAIIAGSVAAFAVLAIPALARNSDTNSDAQRTDDKPVSSSCRAYEQTADGEWKPIPCQEAGSAARTQHRHATGSADDATH
jgi:hypothetical protein